MRSNVSKYTVTDTTNPEAWAICDRCNFARNRSDLVWQLQWSGVSLWNTRMLVCFDRCYDTPNEQLRTIILPPDPPPIINSRPPNYTYENNGPVQSTLLADVLPGATSLPLNSADGFAVGNSVWVQLNNATYAEEQITNVNTTTNTVTIASPLPFSAPVNGSVTVSNSPD